MIEEVVAIDFGISIVFVAKIVSLNLANVFDKLTIFCKAIKIEFKNNLSSIILTDCNFFVNPSNKALNSSAAEANSLKPSIFMSNSMFLYHSQFGTQQ